MQKYQKTLTVIDWHIAQLRVMRLWHTEIQKEAANSLSMD